MNTYTQTELSGIASRFEIEGEIAEITPLGPGFINDTLIIKTFPKAEGKSSGYILQRKNHLVFPDVPEMMHNIEMITSHIKTKVEANGGNPLKEVLTLIKRKESGMTSEEKEMPHSELYYKDSRGNFWAMCLLIEPSVTYEKAATPELCYKGGQGIGKFQSYLADFTTPLSETIKGFHDIRWRFHQWEEALERNAAGRLGSLKEEINWIESRKEQMLQFRELIENGTIPTRVAHNDTKISNILFDQNKEVLCVIDLDTCMSSTSLNDFGDAIRSYTNTGAEDDCDLSKVSMSLEMFKAYTEGYLSERKDTLCKSEFDNLSFSALYITFEQVLRFLMDYIDGDIYYKTSYPEHNLVRANAQYKLLQSMEEQYEQMKNIVKAYSI